MPAYVIFGAVALIDIGLLVFKQVVLQGTGDSYPGATGSGGSWDEFVDDFMWSEEAYEAAAESGWFSDFSGGWSEDGDYTEEELAAAFGDDWMA